MNDLQIFKSDKFGEIRTLEDESGKVLFCGSDVAKALGYADTAKAIKLHCKEDGWAICPVIDSMGREQQAKFINEGNVYRLITHSKLPAAQQFESWVFDEVLPTIRRHGAYMNDSTLEQALTSPDFLIQLATKLKEEKAKRIELETKIENGTLVPKYSIVDCGGTYCVCTVDTDNLLVIGEYDTEEEAKQRLEEIRNKNEN